MNRILQNAKSIKKKRICLFLLFQFNILSLVSFSLQASEKQSYYFEDLSYDLPVESMTVVAVDPGDPEVFYAGNDGFLFKSDDAGETWLTILSFPTGLPIYNSDLENKLPKNQLNQNLDEDDIADLVADIAEESGEEFDNGNDDQNRLFLEDETGISLDNTNSQVSNSLDARDQKFYERIGVRAIRFVDASSSELYVATPRALFYSKNAGKDFVHIDLPGGVDSQNIIDCLYIKDGKYDLLVIATSGIWLRSRDAKIFMLLPESSDFDALSLSAAEKNKPHHFIIGTSEGAFLFNSDFLSLESLALNGVDSESQSVHTVAFDQYLDQIYAAHGDELFVGNIHEKNLYPVTTIGHPKIIAIQTHPKNGGEVLFGTLGFGTLKSIDGGHHIIDMEFKLAAASTTSIAFIEASKNEYIVATERGIFKNRLGFPPTFSVEDARKHMAFIRSEPSLEQGIAALLKSFQLTPKETMEWQDRQVSSNILPRIWLSYQYTKDTDYLPNNFSIYRGDPFNQNSFNDFDGHNHIVNLSLQWFPERFIFNNSGFNKRKVHEVLYTRQSTLVDHFIKVYEIRREIQQKVFLLERNTKEKELLFQKLKFDSETAILNGLLNQKFYRKLWEKS